ncbi:MAG: hypothetical protein IE919_09990 [Thioclava sp.]|nr:hypothetical protein [Thioclava sp.]MBD3803554.1 hypothetical protein [Thioclava sp.]
MTSYTDIPNDIIDQDSPVTQPLLAALRDNTLAIAEGDATAPNLLLGLVARSTPGAVGTYIFASAGTDAAFGDIVAGSTLTLTSAARGAKINSNYTSSLTSMLADAGGLSGSWMCMGKMDAVRDSYLTLYGATIWLRVA